MSDHRDTPRGGYMEQFMAKEGDDDYIPPEGILLTDLCEESVNRERDRKPDEGKKSIRKPDPNLFFQTKVTITPPAKTGASSARAQPSRQTRSTQRKLEAGRSGAQAAPSTRAPDSEEDSKPRKKRRTGKGKDSARHVEIDDWDFEEARQAPSIPYTASDPVFWKGGLLTEREKELAQHHQTTTTASAQKLRPTQKYKEFYKTTYPRFKTNTSVIQNDSSSTMIKIQNAAASGSDTHIERDTNLSQYKDVDWDAHPQWRQDWGDIDLTAPLTPFWRPQEQKLLLIEKILTVALFRYPSRNTERSPVAKGRLIRTTEKRRDWLKMALYIQLAYRQLESARELPATELCCRALELAHNTLRYLPLPIQVEPITFEQWDGYNITQPVINAEGIILSEQEIWHVCDAKLKTLSVALVEVMEVDVIGAEKEMKEKAEMEGTTVSELEGPRLRGSHSVIDINNEDDEDEGDDEDEFKMTSFVDLTQAPLTIDLTQGPQTIDLTGDSTKTFTKEEKGKGKEMPRAGAAPSTKRKRLASTEQDVADHNDTANEDKTPSPRKKTKQLGKSIRRFLDTEAADDGSELDEEEDEEEEAGFIDYDDTRSTSSVNPRRQTPPADDYIDVEDAMDRLQARYRATYATKRHRVPSAALQLDGSSRVPKELHEDAISAWEFSAPELALFPDRVTIFRLKCKIGHERDIVYSILNIDTDTDTFKHAGLKCAWYNETTKGYIYFECVTSMKYPVITALTKSGIINLYTTSRTNDSPAQDVPMNEWGVLLSPYQDTTSKNDCWVTVVSGPLKGEVGYRLSSGVDAEHVDIAVVPRSLPKKEKGRTNKKSAVKGKHELFQPERIKVVHGEESVERINPNTFIFQDIRYSHGLAIHSLPLHNISTRDVKLSISVGVLFFEAKHPDVTLNTIPRPFEWHFDMWDRVFVAPRPDKGHAAPSQVKGHIKDATKNAALVVLESGGELSVPWRDVYKRIEVGDDVTSCAPATAGLTGWVVEIYNHVATVAYEKRNYIDTLRRATGIQEMGKQYLEFICPVNCLRVSAEPIPRTVPQAVTNAIQETSTGKIPWRGLQVQIIKGPHKSKLATITDVLIRQKTNSGLMIQAKIDTVGDSTAAHGPILDYDCIMTMNNRYLHEEYILRRSDIWFRPRNASTLTTPEPAHPMTTVADPWLKQRGATPIPANDENIRSPAWDPRSRTPPPRPYFHKYPSPPKTPPLPYWAADPRLSGKKFRVIAEGQGWNGQKVEVTQTLVGDKVMLECRFEARTRQIEPTLAKPISPTAARASGRHLVIAGDHFGKLVKRYKNPSKGSNQIPVVRVEKRESGAEEIIGWDRFEVAAEDLTAAVEEVDEKAANNTQFTAWKKTL